MSTYDEETVSCSVAEPGLFRPYGPEASPTIVWVMLVALYTLTTYPWR
jgi:hypothetical protein